jgi:hemerythrin-like domain-containing protein
MKPTEELTEEHKAIKEMLHILDLVCDKLESGQDIDPQHLEKIIEFIRGFADKCHHMKEEDVLFPAMEKAGIPREGGPIGVMLAEHTMGRDYVRAMSEAAAGYAAGNRAAAARFVENARNYTDLLTQHIDKEDNVLYVIADAHLSKQRQEEIEKAFEKIEAEKIGPGKHEEFHIIVHHLKQIYP